MSAHTRLQEIRARKEELAVAQTERELVPLVEAMTLVDEVAGAVVTLHVDLSAALEQRGIKVTVLRAGAQKMAANPFEPLADDTIQRLFGDLEAARTTFAESVGRYRGSRFTSQAALATEAQDYRGGEAVALGLADATGLNAFDGFVRAIKAKK